MSQSILLDDSTSIHLVETVNVRVHPLLFGLREVPLLGADVHGAEPRHLSEELAVVVDRHQGALVFALLLYAY